MRAMTDSVLDVAREALAVGMAALPLHTKFSRKDYTLPQLFAILVVRQFLNLNLRRTEQLFRDFSELRKAIGLKDVPHFTVIFRAEKRLLETGALSGRCLELYSPAPANAA